MELSKGSPRCLRAEDVAAYLGGALPPPEASILEAHAADCNACRELLSALARLTASADTTPGLAGLPDIAAAGAGPARGPPLAGSIIGRYEVLEQLGIGGMGVVHAAYDPQLKRRIVYGRGDWPRARAITFVVPAGMTPTRTLLLRGL